MNVLPLVFSFLALLTILTYTRLSGFVVSRAIHNEYEHFIADYQEGIQEKTALVKYKDKTRNSESQGQRGPSIQAYRCLNIQPLFENESEKAIEARWLLKNLLEDLFAQTSFYKESIEQNPKLLDDLMDGLKSSYSNRKKEAKFIKEDLPTLELNDPLLQYFLYKILKEPASVQDDSDEKSLIEKKGSRILNDLIYFKKEQLPIRIFLADPTLLKAIFQNQAVVDKIIIERKNYYRAVLKDSDRREALTDAFRGKFLSDLPPQIQPQSVNWDVSGTDPDKKKRKELKKGDA